MFASSSNVLALLALAFVSQTAIAGPSVIPARAGLRSKLTRRAMKIKRIDDAQNSLQLDPSQIGSNLALTGQEIPTAGQVPSLTSTNNFINFCLTQNTVLTDGKQITTGSCNQTPMGRIIATDKMPVSRFTFPPNGGAIKANTGFTLKMTVVNIDAGHFTNPTSTYYNAPQTVNAIGQGVGHTHAVIEKIPAFDTQELTDPRNFAFFKGLNAAADANGQLTADVTGGLPVGFYKLTSINTASNHMPFLVAVAQHGTSDDSIFFEVTNDGKPSAANIAANPVNTVDTNASASVSATASSTASSVLVSASISTTAASAATSSAAATGKADTGKNAVTASVSETKAASSTAIASSAATTSSATTGKGANNKDNKKVTDSVVSSAAVPTSSPVKGAASSSAASSSASAVTSSAVASSTASTSGATSTSKADNKGNGKN